MTITGDLREPAVGSAVRLLPVVEGGERAGTISEWTAGPAGLVVTARVAMAPEDAQALSGRRVWARVDAGEGATSVLEAVASMDVAGTALVLTGVLSLVHETRRTEPRAETARRAQLRSRAAGGTVAAAAAAARTVDLSRTGARLQLPPGTAPLPVGDAPVEVTLEVGESQAVSATAHVVRVDAQRQEVAVRFVDLMEGDAQRIDRLVLAELSSQYAGEHPDAD
jgi:PilZ domain